MKIRFGLLAAFIVLLAFDAEGLIPPAHPRCVAPTSSFRYSDFQQLLARKPASIAELLALVPATVLERVAIMQDSGSLQSATPTLPRVLVFGADDFVFTFNGDPSQRGFEAIEIMRSDVQDSKFSFEEIVFPADLERRTSFVTQALSRHEGDLGPHDLRELSERGLRTGVNPKLCLQCHGKDPHPILPVYPIGKGLFAGYSGEVAPFNSWRSELRGVWSTNERFGRLPAMVKAGADPTLAAAANREFQRHFTCENTERILRRLVAHPKFRLHRFAVAAALMDCDNPQSFVGPGTAVLNFDIEALIHETADLRHEALVRLKADADELALVLPRPLLPENPRTLRIIAKLRGILERQMHFSMSENFDPDDLFGAYLIDEDGTVLAQLRDRINAEIGFSPASCDELSRETQSAFANGNQDSRFP